MIVNVFDTRAPGKHEAAPAEKGLNVVVVKITKDMTMAQVVSEIKTKVEEKGGGLGSISLMRFFGHGNAGTMEFGKVFRYWTVEPLKELAPYFDPEGKGLELHGCYTGSAVHVPGQDCSNPGRFYPRTHQPGRVGLGYELLYELSFQMKVPVTGGINCQYGDSAHKLEGPTITVSPDGITMRNVPIDKYDDRGGPVAKPKKADSTADVSERIHIMEGDPLTDYKSDPRDALEGDLQDSTDISERIHIIEDTPFDFDTPVDDTDKNYQNWDHDVEYDVSERIHILEEPFEETDFDTDTEDTWQPDSFDEFDEFDRDEFFPEQNHFVDVKDTIPDFDDEFSDFGQDNDFEVPAFDILKDNTHGNLWKDHDFEVPAFDILKDTPHETLGKDHDFTPPSVHIGDTFGSRSLWERSLHPLESTNEFHDTFDNSPPFWQNKQFQEPFHPIQPPEPPHIDFQTPNWQPQNQNKPNWLKK
ncbi:MAG: hypothetical protein PVF58_12850 [Candidatus Methanofastidiosia archaeon]|jgi:hypothetical protein